MFLILTGKSPAQVRSRQIIGNAPLVLILLSFALSSIYAQEPNQKVIELFNAGQDAHQHGNLNEAVKLYTQAIEVDPNIYQIHYQLGIALVSLKRPKEAVKSFENVVRLKPDFAKGLNALGEAQMEALDLDGASDSFSKALKIEPSSAKTHLNLARVLIKQAATIQTGTTDLYSKAKIELETALTLGDKSGQATSLLTVVYAKTGDRPAAIKMLDQVIAAEPGNLDARLTRGHLQFEQGNFAGAVADLEPVYKMNQSAEVAAELSDAYTKVNRTADALTVLGDYVRRNPQDQRLFNLYVNLMTQSGHGDEVVGIVQTYLAEHKNNAFALATMGDILAPKQPEKAVEFYTQAYNLDTGNIDFRLKLGSALVRSKQADKGLPLLQSAVRERPVDYTAHANLATALFSLGRFAEATPEYKWIVNARPQQAVGYYFLAVSWDKQQEYEQAEPVYVMFLKLADPVVNKNEIDTVNFRLPGLRRLISEKKGKRHP